ncbi:MAG TPA: DNA translocase FtsK [Solirubrobacterales bacterium]|jgi:S-DNA-T family DNA segregation ATPase FtsK/SpoIIIE
MSRARKTGARASASRKRAPARGKRSGGGLRAAVGGLEQRHYDLIGLALVASGVYCAFVLYLDWDGGPVGEGIVTALEYAVGKLAFLAPIALFAGGVALIARPMIDAPRALGAGAALILLAIALALAAETLGLGPDRPARHGYFEPRFYRTHGGILGETLYWASTQLFQRLGAQILAVLLLIWGALLASGTTIASLLHGASGAARRARESTREMARTVREASPIEWGDAPGDEIAITRVSETQDFTTQALNEPDEASEPEWDDDPEDAEEEAAGSAATSAFAYEVVHGDDEPEEEPAPPIDDGDVERTPMGKRKEGITTSDELDYKLPSPKLLERGKGDMGPDPRDSEATAKALLEALAHFGVEARMLGMVSGPHVSRYELQLAPGTKVGKVAQLKDDLAYALASTDIRILAPIPGKKAVGVEVPNSRRRLVRLGDIYEGRPKNSSPLVCWLGKDVSGQAVWTDIALMPHLLVAGTTGSGKSGCINAILSSILLHASPNECRFVLVDPKRVELNHYENLPHLLTPVVTNPRLASNVLANLIGEMESRYQVMGEARARNLVELNKARRRSGERPLPHILCVIDELADLMMVAPAEVEDSIIRLAQKSRAVGIHLVLATQRPSTDVITGTIKVNIPARIAFAVASQVDSRVILDQGGAETLLGQGDMLFRPIGTSKLQRIQGAFLTEEEIARLTNHWAKQGEPDFDEELLEERKEEGGDVDKDEFSPDQDDLLEDAARIVVESGTASVSMIQRRLRVGYTRAGRLIDMLERRGIISGYEGSKPRQVLVSAADLPRILGGEAPAEGESADVQEPEAVESR